jgi:hypothetical protein
MTAKPKRAASSAARTQGGDKSHRGNAAQFFVAGELCRRGLVAVVTLGNCPNTDILVSNTAGDRFCHVQVKTFVPGIKTVSVGKKAEKDFGSSFFWIIAGIPTPESNGEFVYYIVPSKVISKAVRADFERWVATPGKKGQQHNADMTLRALRLPQARRPEDLDLSPYENRWDLIERHFAT